MLRRRHRAASRTPSSWRVSTLAPMVSNSASNFFNRRPLRCSRFLKPFAHQPRRRSLVASHWLAVLDWFKKEDAWAVSRLRSLLYNGCLHSEMMRGFCPPAKGSVTFGARAAVIVFIVPFDARWRAAARHLARIRQAQPKTHSTDKLVKTPPRCNPPLG